MEYTHGKKVKKAGGGGGGEAGVQEGVYVEFRSKGCVYTPPPPWTQPCIYITRARTLWLKMAVRFWSPEASWLSDYGFTTETTDR